MPYFVNVSSANIYHEASFHSEVDTQAVLWEQVLIIKEENDFVQIQTEDGYSGWINKHQLYRVERAPRLQMVTTPVLWIRKKPETNSPVVRDVAAGAYLAIEKEENAWFEVVLPDGVSGWVPASAFTPMPQLSRETLIQTAFLFLGVPYIWAGKTGKGLDCSGFTQMVHKLYGIRLRRDARMQFEDARPVSADPLGGQKGDLLFFAENGKRITHVGFALENGRILHARGMVRINSLNENDDDFDRNLRNHFVEIRTFLPE